VHGWFWPAGQGCVGPLQGSLRKLTSTSSNIEVRVIVLIYDDGVSNDII
jgi:hypothetical protein